VARLGRARADYAALPTERAHPRTRHLHRLTARELVELIGAEDQRAAAATRAVGRPLAGAVELVATALAEGGRLIYVGAGTSGRLGVLDAAECPPTFGVRPGQVVGVIAGGARALSRAVEGAEDDAGAARRALVRLGVGRADLVCAICMSGVTRFTLAALRLGRQRGARTVLVTCAPSPRHTGLAEVVIAPRVGPEIIAGSTRMKGGLATKMILHTLTTAAMIRLGRIYGQLMVDVRPTSAKLRARAVRIVGALTDLSPAAARALLGRAGWRVKVAVVMHRRRVGAGVARRLLGARGGRLDAVLEG
jgi:N-acetylmuramic acid 6-phosphate etherase